MALERILETEVMDTLEDAVEYDSMDFTDVNTAFAERALEVAPPEGILLDVGTGTARIPILIVQRRPALRIWAIDLSQNMLMVGEKNVREAGVGQNVKLRKVDAKALPYPKNYFDMVISNSIIHHLPDPLPFLKEVDRVTRPSGGIFIRDLFRPPDMKTLEDLTQKYAGDATEYQKKLYRDSLHASFTLDEVGELIEKAGLKDVAVVQSSDRHWSAERAWKPPDDR
ncbi:MAG: methyltransferase domain-containing protein [Bacteroidota bacterium]